MKEETLDIAALKRELRAFAHAREWEQFHTPKNLVMALSVEAAELVEIFQWRSFAESRKIMEDPSTAQAVRDEVADVMIYVLRISDLLGIDVRAAISEKIAKNALKYPPLPSAVSTKSLDS